MKKHAISVGLGLLLSLAAALPALAQGQAHYLSRADLDLASVLGEPPQPGSGEQERDLAGLLWAQERRTPAQIQAAQAPNELGVFQFSDALGATFREDALPLTAAFFKTVQQDTLDILEPAKNRWKRPRPFLTHPQLNTLGEKPKSTSYPSGNALLGYVYAVVLADILPEKREAIFRKGLDIGDARIVAGVHYPSDVAAGRLAGVAIATRLAAQPDFRRDRAAAAAELRHALLPH